MPTGHFTDADRALHDQLTARLAGSSVPAPSLRSLQEWRRLGLVPQEVERLGRGRVVVTYPPEALDRAEEVARALKRLDVMPLVILGLFGAGRTMTERALREAFRWIFDRDEAAGVRLLSLAHDESPRFSEAVYRGAGRAAGEVPEFVEQLNRLAQATAGAEAAEPDVATGEPVVCTSRQVREDMIRDLAAAYIDPAQVTGDYEGLLDDIDPSMLDEVGELPTIAEMRQAIDTATFGEIVAGRDVLRAGFREYVPRLAPGSAVVDYIAATFNDPRTGIEIACALVAGLAVERRANAAALAGSRRAGWDRAAGAGIHS
ncbi:MAG: hypothetical protein ACRD0B_00170 [Acidimicrobiales bacterium]